MRLSRLFSDNMILQHGKKSTLAGWAKVDVKVLVEILDLSESASSGKKCFEQAVVVDEDGRFCVELPVMDAGGPYEIRVSDGDSEVIIKNVLVGDVFWLGGQSNMELPIGMLPDTNESDLVDANYPMIRQFEVPKVYGFSGEIQEIKDGQWKSATVDNIAGFSAIGYYFAREKYLNDGIPVGLVQTAVGGAPIEALMSETNLLECASIIRRRRQVFAPCDRNKNMGCIHCYEELLEKVKIPGFIENTEKDDLARIAKWHEDLDAKDAGLIANWMKETEVFDSANTITIPGFFSGGEYEDFTGTLWLQKKISLDSSWVGKKVRLSLGTVVDSDVTYVNGIKVGETTYKYPPRRYDLLENVLHEGENTITIRMGMDSNVGGFLPDMPYCLKCGGKTIDLTGDWSVRIGTTAEKLEGPTFFIWNPTALFNTMIAPLKGIAFNSILFYQGESNCGRSEYYEVLFEALIEEWRQVAADEDIDFFYAELASYLGDGPEYVSDPFSGVRDVQRLCEKNLHNTYLIANEDLGQYNELHPQEKTKIAHRFYEKFIEVSK